MSLQLQLHVSTMYVVCVILYEFHSLKDNESSSATYIENFKIQILRKQALFPNLHNSFFNTKVTRTLNFKIDSAPTHQSNLKKNI